jgi:DNA polymerase III alpha subunit
MTALNNSNAAKLNLCYGLKLKICRDVNDKSPASRDTESNVIVFLRDDAYYSNFVKIWNRANIDHSYYYPRIDSNLLKEFWVPEGFMLAFPFYSSFLAKNYLTLSECIVDYGFTDPIFFMEDSGLPFDSLIGRRLLDFARGNNLKVVPSRSIYYHKYSDFRSYQIMRCIKKGSSLDAPNVDHFCSDRFCFEDFLNSINYGSKE